jgi:hypothetical protein
MIIIYLVTQSRGEKWVTSLYTLRTVWPYCAYFQGYCGYVFIRPTGFSRLQLIHELNLLAIAPNIMG